MNYFFLLIVQPRYILLQVVNKEVKKKKTFKGKNMK